MELIERYIATVSGYLPEKMRVDVENELKSNILDMLSDEPTDEEIIGVLESLGNPSDMAMEYFPSKRYLIGPMLFPRYLYVLKLVLSIVAISFMVIVGIKWAFSGDLSDSLVIGLTGFLADSIATVIQGLFQAAFWVTVVFAVLEYNHVMRGTEKSKGNTWKISDLPKQTLTDKNRIKRSNTVVSICFSIFFAFLLFAQPSVIGIIIAKTDNATIIPLFNETRLRDYLIAIFLVTLFSISISVWKLITERWTKSIALANLVLNLLVIGLIFIMFLDKSLWNASIVDTLSTYMESDSATALISLWSNSVKIGLVIFTAIIAFDVFDGFRRSMH